MTGETAYLSSVKRLPMARLQLPNTALVSTALHTEKGVSSKRPLE